MIVINKDLNHEILTPEAEKNLLINYKVYGNQESLEELVRCNQRFIIKMLYSLNVYNYDLYDDLIQEGNFGLVVAINRFDLNSNMKLSTYSSHWIKHYILKYLKNKKNLIKLPEYIMNIISLYVKGENLEKISQVVNLTEEKIESIIDKYRLGIYEESNMLATIYNSSAIDLNEKNINSKIMDEVFLEEIKSILTKREFAIIKLKFIDCIDYGNIGLMFGFSRQNAHSISQKALKKLRRFFIKYEKLNKRSDYNEFCSSNSTIFQK